MSGPVPSPSMKGITGWSGTRSFPPWSSMGCAPLGICGLGLGVKAPVLDARTYAPPRCTCLGPPKWIFALAYQRYVVRGGPPEVVHAARVPVPEVRGRLLGRDREPEQRSG